MRVGGGAPPHLRPDLPLYGIFPTCCLFDHEFGLSLPIILLLLGQGRRGVLILPGIWLQPGRPEECICTKSTWRIIEGLCDGSFTFFCDSRWFLCFEVEGFLCRRSLHTVL